MRPEADHTFQQHLSTIKQNPALLQSLTRLQRGIEKESLRINPQGQLAMTDHPFHLGSALCHPKITTDYSEALLEFITPVHQSIGETLHALADVHSYSYQTLAKQDELIWTNSMPCALVREQAIPVAHYGSSNVAKMKKIYRLGLGVRYSRMMQTIAGVHYNFSLSEKFWANFYSMQNSDRPLDQFKTEKYFGLIRNFRRLAPLFVYLFGASPALSKSFLQGQSHQLQQYDAETCFNPYATSLRMSDLGYQSTAQEALFVCYNNLESYISTLKRGINTSYADYEKIGLKDQHQQYQQLNNALLQIENEFYSIIRPKRVAASGEAPLNALARGGVEYIEIRCIDVNPFKPLGIDEHCLRFLDLLLLFCLLSDSPEVSPQQCQEHSDNLKRVVTEGRRPNLDIMVDGKPVNFSQWCQQQLHSIRELALVLDSLRANSDYNISVNKQMLKVQHPELTPSAKVLHTMQEQQQSFLDFGLMQSKKWQQYFLSQPADPNNQQKFIELALNSHAQQKTIEAAEQKPFDQYLREFYAQYQ
ncbi:MAG: glutamate--cysteine ligase [Pseudomonadales bacterium]|nr:glutamate--cysteine ligase [Pseudomonadales bacterium]